jgi:hypothetical protein
VIIVYMTVEGDGTPIPIPGRVSALADLWVSPDNSAPSGSAEVISGEHELSWRRRGFAVLLGEFRRTAVLVPLDEAGVPWTADNGGVRWVCAFSDEEALAGFARMRGDTGREWIYRSVWGARLLDVIVPALGVPAGVALDVGSATGMLFPPVAGAVPDAAVVGSGGTV